MHYCQGVTEAGSRPLLRQPSSTHQRAAPRHTDLPWHQLMEAPPCWTEDFTCPAAHLAPEILPCKTLTIPLLPVLSPGPADWDSGTQVHYPPILSCDVITDSSWVISIVIRVVQIWIKCSLTKAEGIAQSPMWGPCYFSVLVLPVGLEVVQAPRYFRFLKLWSKWGLKAGL